MDFSAPSKVGLPVPGSPSPFHVALLELGEAHERELLSVREHLEAKLLLQNQELEELRAGGDVMVQWKSSMVSHFSHISHIASGRSGKRRDPSPDGIVGRIRSNNNNNSNIRRSLWRGRSQSSFSVPGDSHGPRRKPCSPVNSALNLTVLPDDLALFSEWKKEERRFQSLSDSPFSQLRSTNLSSMVSKQGFDALCSVMIIGNAILMGISVDWGVKNFRETQFPVALEIVDRMFTVWFLLELFLRICGHGLLFFVTKENWSWNLFDFVVVMSDIVMTLIQVVSPSDESTNVGGNVSTVRLLRVLRVTRALRIVRLFRFFRELRMMVFSVLKSGTSLAWSVVLFFLDVFLFAVLLTQQTTAFLRDEAEEPEYHATSEKLLRFFGSLDKAIYTLFMSVSGGISWVEISTPLFEAHWSNAAVFIFFIFFTIYALTNIITGIFVDGAIQSAQSDRDEVIQTQMHTRNTTLQQMRELFLEADMDGSGTISLQELEVHLSDMRVRCHLTALGLQLDEARGLFRLLDINKSGALNIDEFIFGCMRLKGNAKSIDLATLMYENRKMFKMMACFFDYAEEEFGKVDLITRFLLPSGGGGGLHVEQNAAPLGASPRELDRSAELNENMKETL